jgi:hypothetical protein
MTPLFGVVPPDRPSEPEQDDPDAEAKERLRLQRRHYCGDFSIDENLYGICG